MTLRPLVLLGIVVSMVTGVALGILGHRAWLAPLAETSSYARDFDRVLSEVHDNYVDEVPKDQLIRNALRGMLDRLDDHSGFLDPGEFGNLQVETTGSFGGIGIEIGLQDGWITVVTPLDGTPAAAAGLASGDRILEIDRKSQKGVRLTDAVQSLRGRPGTRVHLRLRRGSGGEPWDVVLTRAPIELASLTARMLEPGFAYVRISQFQVQTGTAFERALADLKVRSGGALDGLVLDLRDNPGGVLQASVAVADALLAEGLIVYTEGRQESSRLKFRAAAGDALDGAPIVVLINQASASAAEIVAGALQDHGRAVVMGTRSYGKGSVQSVVPVPGDQAIKLTTAYYYTPGGRSIHRAGIVPDIERPARPESGALDDEHIVSEALAVLKGRASFHARL
jgi:carboxyl-terminal processing protease